MLYAVIDLQMFLFYILIIGVGLGMAEKGLATIPVVVFIANLQMSIGYALSQVARDFADLQRYVVAAHRVFEVLDAPAEEDRPDRETADFAADYAAELRAVGVAGEAVGDDERQVTGRWRGGVVYGRPGIVYGIDRNPVGRVQKRPQWCASARLGVRTNGGTCHMTCRTVAHVGYSAGQRTRAA